MEEIKKQKGIIVSGYFNPLHKGHLEYFNKSKNLGDKLFVIVNNDNQRILKGSKKFMLEDERVMIIESLSLIDYTFLSIDQDLTVCKTIKLIFDEFSSVYSFSFANGGDQTNERIPEYSICKKLGIDLIDGMGEKIQSSSWILKNK
tara:strand:+ start:868 stop:1305 length:438 start_codon:yes stop_codon:yes gene_type:complete